MTGSRSTRRLSSQSSIRGRSPLRTSNSSTVYPSGFAWPFSPPTGVAMPSPHPPPPPLSRLADATPGLELSIFNRDEVMDLTNSFLPAHRNGTLPVFVVFDPQMREVAPSQGDTASQTAIRGRRMAYRVAHAREWGQVLTHAFTAVVKAGLALPPERRPAERGTEWPPPQQLTASVRVMHQAPRWTFGSQRPE